MRQQSYLIRKGARYHFRRRIGHFGINHPITISLNTSEPAEARRLARRLAVKWDDITMGMVREVGRGTLKLDEVTAFMRQGLEYELPHATRHLLTPSSNALATPNNFHKIMATAYRIIARMPHNAEVLEGTRIKAECDGTWSKSDRELLHKVLSFLVTPSSVSREDAVDALTKMNVPVNEGTVREARAQILRGMAEAHDRAELIGTPRAGAAFSAIGSLLDDAAVEDLRARAGERPAPVQRWPEEAVDGDVCPFANRTTVRFSEQIDDLITIMEQKKKYKRDNGQRRRVLQVFAWVTGDKVMSEYRSEDVEAFVALLRTIPTDVRFGRLYEKGRMAAPFEQASIPKVSAETKRNDRTINRDLSILSAASECLKKSFWKPRRGFALEMNFLEEWIDIENDPNDPKRMPWTPDHLIAMYSLPLWQGGGGAGSRIKSVQSPVIYQDAAYWMPLIATYTGLAREEAAGLEVIDFYFDCEVPYLLVQANMTRSKDGKNPDGLKRKSRYRVMPLHPELLRLGLRDYVEAIEDEQWDNWGEDKIIPIFPELYSSDAKKRQNDRDEGGLKVPAFGGRRFYAIAWRFLMDATHAIMPLPETRTGKKADFHSQRTYAVSVLADSTVSDAIINAHMGHAQVGTARRNYIRRGLTLGQLNELRERLKIMIEMMPNVTSHVPKADQVRLLPLKKRSRVGSAKGRNAIHRFCE